MSTAIGEIDLVATLAALELARTIEADAPSPAALERLARSLPASSLDHERRLLLADAYGAVLASVPPLPNRPRTLAGLLGDAQPLTTLADRAGVMSLQLADGSDAIATVRNVPGGHVVVMQPVSGILAGFQAQQISDFAVVGLLLALSGSLAVVCFRQRRLTSSAHRDRQNITRRLDTSLSSGRCGVWDWDLARGRITWSDSLYDLLGYERRDDFLSFGELEALLHPGDIDLYQIAEELASARTTQMDREFRIRTAAGDWLWLRARAEMLQDPRDGARHLVGTAVDVSDERDRIEQSAAADMRLRDAIEAISEAFVLWDADNRLVLCNSKFRNLHDLSNEIAVPGTSYSEIMEAARPPVIEHQLSHGQTCESGARTLEAQLSDGRWLHINERRTKDGGFVSVGTDITDLKRHEKQLLQSEGELINTVSDLRRSRQTLERQKQQLADLLERNHEQKAEAESANRAKTEFLAKMSHELRTPLNAIIGFADIMQHGMFGTIDKRYAGYSKDIHQSGHYLLSIINDILDMSKLEAGRMELSTEPVAVEAAVQRAVETIMGPAESKKITVSVSAESDAVVLADDRALHQTLVNLMQNAVKFTPKGGAINVRVRKAGAAANIFIEDSGIGIPPAALAKIGKPFEQVESEFRRSYKGSGLGLAIARSLTELHGGKLRIRSQQGAGTIVLVHLPTADSEAALTSHAA
jgi:two-component system cell cycle sensor histidine kinase PleC